MKNKRLSCPTLIILYTRERGLRVCARVYYRQVSLLTPTAEYPRPGTNPPKTEFINIKSPGMWLTCRQYLGILKREN